MVSLERFHVKQTDVFFQFVFLVASKCRILQRKSVVERLFVPYTSLDTLNVLLH